MEVINFRGARQGTLRSDDQANVTLGSSNPTDIFRVHCVSECTILSPAH